MNNKKRIIFVFVIIIVLIAVSYIFINNKKVTDKGEQKENKFVNYVNAEGEEWKIQRGEYSFNVSSNKGYPKIISGVIDPLDVKPGNLQKMEVVVNSNIEIKKVWAEIETDKGMDEVGLDLFSTTTVANKGSHEEDLPFVVNNAGVLEIRKKRNFVMKIIDKVFNDVEAEDDVVIQHVFKGEWVVHDTHNTTYRTTFVVEGVDGSKDDLTLAWSDPNCDFDGGVLSGSCSPSSVEGYDGGDYDLDVSDVTLNSGGYLVSNPGSKITISDGKIVFNGGSLVEDYLYLPDSDGDNYAPSNYSFSYGSNSTAPADKMRAKDSNTNPYTGNNTDCDDNWDSGWRWASDVISGTWFLDDDQDGYHAGTYEFDSNVCTGAQNGNYLEAEWYYTSSDYGSRGWWTSGGYIADGGDCDETDDEKHPNAPAGFSDKDYNCDGGETSVWQKQSICNSGDPNFCGTADYNSPDPYGPYICNQSYGAFTATNYIGSALPYTGSWYTFTGSSCDSYLFYGTPMGAYR